MDGESSCESDISESWSLIDLNLNEQLADGKSLDIQSSSSSEATPKEITKKENDCENEKKIPGENFELMEFSNNANQLDDSQTVVSSAVDSPKKEISSTELFQDFIFLNEGNRVEEIEKEKNDLHENVKFNLNDVEILEGEHKARDTDFDTDGISVISDAECAECDETRFYSNENDKNWEEELQTEYLNNAFESNNQTVIKKRRRRVKVYNDSSDDNLNSSDLVVPDRKFSDSFSSINDEMQVSVNATKPVYRHYRNNVANTVLSLAMGVIFAGVACIALGHFLGVHDAEQTAGEMMEALKRLQMENIQLQSRLSHLSRVFFTREIQQKPDLTPNNFPTHNCIDSDLNQQIYKTEDIKKDNTGELSGEIQNDFKSISKIANLIKKGDLVNSKLETNIENILHQIHDHMIFLNNITKNDPKLKRFQELDSKIAGFIDKLAQNPPKTEIGLENLLKRLQKFSEKLNQKICRNYSDLTDSNINCGIKKYEDKGQNLKMFQWFPVKEENEYPMVKINSVTSNENPTLFKFPQPEIYYENVQTDLISQGDDASSEVKNSGESDVVIEEEMELDQEGPKEEIISSTPAPLPLEYVPLTEPSNVVKIELDPKIINNFRGNKTYEKEHKKKEKKRKEDKRKFDKSSDYKKIKKENYKYDEVKKSKYDKENAYKEKYNKKIWKEYVKKKKYDEHKERKYDEHKSKKFYKKDDQRKETKPSDKIKNKSYKPTQKEKYEKKSKKDYYKNSDWENKSKKYKNKKSDARYVKNPNAKLFNPINFNKCGSNCYNMSGEWVYKMAKGREQCRRHKRLSDWQFDRARSRESSRDVEGNWFFERAAAREIDRDDAKWYFKRYDARNHQRKGFSPETFSWI